MAETANPAGEAAHDGAKAPPALITEITNSDEKAVESVQARIDALFKPQPEPEAEPETEPTPEPEAADKTPAKAEEPDEAETPEAEPTDDKGEEPLDLSTVPNTVEGLAEAIGLTPEEFSEHVRVTVKVNGKEHAVTLAEAVKGHQLEADYRTKTSELAETRRQFGVQVEQAQQALQSRAQHLDDLIAAVSSQLDLGPDDTVLRKMLDSNDPTYDPNGYLVQKAIREEKMGAILKARQVQIEAGQKRDAEANANFVKWRKVQQDTLVSDFPELKDKSKLQEFENETRSSLTAYYVFADEEVDRFMKTFDARQVRIVRDAVKFRKMENGKKKLELKLKGIPKVTRSGTSQGKKGSEGEAKLQAIRRGGKNAEKAAHSWLMDKV